MNVGKQKGDLNETYKEIDKIAFIYIEGKKILSTRSKGNSIWYLPGGKREKGENDVEVLVREVTEELSVDIVISTIRYLGTFKAQADNHPEGVVVKMTCYTANYVGDLYPTSEIDEIEFLTIKDKSKSSPVDVLILEWLYESGLID